MARGGVSLRASSQKAGAFPRLWSREGFKERDGEVYRVTNGGGVQGEDEDPGRGEKWMLGYGPSTPSTSITLNLGVWGVSGIVPTA